MAVELDYCEYSSDELAQAAFVSSDKTWDLLDEDCSDISDWFDADVGTGVSEVSPAGQFRFDTNTSNGGAGGNYAGRYRSIGSPPNKFTLEIKTYFDNIGTLGNSDYLGLSYYTASWRLKIRFASDGLFIYKAGNASTEVGTNIVKSNGGAAWQVWRFEVDKSGGEAVATVEVFLDGVSQGTFDCDYETGAVDGRMFFQQNGFWNNDQVSHLDYIKVVTGISPAPHLESYSEPSIKVQGSYSLKGVAKIAGSLNDTLIRTVSPTIDLSGEDGLKYQIRGSRTGSNIKIGIRDSGGTITEHTPNISGADTWEQQAWNISGVSDANKDAIDQIIITIINADAENTFYLDDMYAGPFAKALADTLAFADAVIKKTSRSLADTLAFTDVVTKKAKRLLTDSLAFTDSIVKKAKKVLADTLAFTDALSRAVAYVRTLADTLAFTDSIVKKMIFLRAKFTDTLAFTDAMGPKTIKKALSDTLAFAERLFMWWHKHRPTGTHVEKTRPSGTYIEKDRLPGD